MKIRVCRLDPAVALLAYQSEGAAAFDLAARDEVVIGPREIRLVATGLVIEAPPGHFLAIVARSSLPLKKGLVVANAVGVVDRDYCGPADEVKVQVMNVGEQPVTIARGERIAQGLILPVTRVEFEEVGTIAADSRGGFGSTGGYSTSRPT